MAVTKLTSCLMFISLFIAESQATVGSACKDNTQCGSGECCQTLNLSIIVSRRETSNPLVNLINPRTQGTCQLYRKTGEPCDVFEHMNGYCGCGPDLTCQMKQVPISTRMIIAPEPGFRWESKCAAKV